MPELDRFWIWNSAPSHSRRNEEEWWCFILLCQDKNVVTPSYVGLQIPKLGYRGFLSSVVSLSRHDGDEWRYLFLFYEDINVGRLIPELDWATPELDWVRVERFILSYYYGSQLNIGRSIPEWAKVESLYSPIVMGTSWISRGQPLNLTRWRSKAQYLSNCAGINMMIYPLLMSGKDACIKLDLTNMMICRQILVTSLPDILKFSRCLSHGDIGELSFL